MQVVSAWLTPCLPQKAIVNRIGALVIKRELVLAAYDSGAAGSQGAGADIILKRNGNCAIRNRPA